MPDLTREQAECYNLSSDSCLWTASPSASPGYKGHDRVWVVRCAWTRQQKAVTAHAIVDKENMSDLEFLFHPRSIAVVGTPSGPEDTLGAGVLLHSLVEFGYGGRIYPVNPKADGIMGLKAYPDLASVPESPDYVICCLPARLAPKLVRDCVARRVKAIAVYTAGFSEVSEEGRRLERDLAEIAREGGVRLIGPNCMGIYCPRTGLSYNPRVSREAGCIGLVCQSGGNSLVLTMMGNLRGIHFSKVISYGNAADLTEADFIEYLAQDAETEAIGAYIEGLKDGRRFLRVLSEATRRKPVAVVKGGRTGAGMKAAASHTGALASSRARWDALCRQAGAVQVDSLDEMLDFIETCLYMRPPDGPRVGIIGWSGGASVLSADDCEGAGLSVPIFSDGLRQELRRFLPEMGNSVNNPVDSVVVTTPGAVSRGMTAVAGSNEVDFLLVHMPLASSLSAFTSQARRETLEAVIETSRSIGLPVAVAQPHADEPESAEIFYGLQQRCVEAGLPMYSSPSRAGKAISRFIQYHRWKSG